MSAEFDANIAQSGESDLRSRYTDGRDDFSSTL